MGDPLMIEVAPGVRVLHGGPMYIEFARLRREIDWLKPDAARYRWFRKAVGEKQPHAIGSHFIRMGRGAFMYEIPGEDELDAAVDVERSK